jgi:hypothetical protein
MKPKFYLLLFSLLFPFAGFAQSYSASAKMEENKISLGGQTKLQLKVFAPADDFNSKKAFVQWPQITDTISEKIEIVESSSIDTALSADKKSVYLTQTLYITSFDSGYWVIPPFRFLRDGDSTRFFETQAMLLEVAPVILDEAETEIKDIKPPLDAPYTFREMLPFIIAFVLLIIAIALLVRYLRKKKNQIKIPEINVPVLAPHIVALSKLEELSKQKLWQEGKVKEYHTLLTEIVRIYLENRYKIPALEQTSEEIIVSCRTLELEQQSRERLHQMLRLADMVKFAKSAPLPFENEMSLDNAVTFVKETATLVEPATKEELRKEDETHV